MNKENALRVEYAWVIETLYPEDGEHGDILECSYPTQDAEALRIFRQADEPKRIGLCRFTFTLAGGEQERSYLYRVGDLWPDVFECGTSVPIGWRKRMFNSTAKLNEA